MTQLFDTLAREIAIFATDKIEDMSEIKRFYKNLAPEYDHLTSDIIAAIESTESRNSAAVQRAFYFITGGTRRICSLRLELWRRN